RSFDFGLDFNDPGRMDDLNLSATVSLPLYTGGQRSAQLNSAKSQSRSAAHFQEATRQNITFAVVRSWHEIIKAKKQLIAQEASQNAIQRNLKNAGIQYGTGKSLRTEVLNLEVQAAQANEKLVQAKLALDLAKLALFNLMGEEKIPEGFDIIESAGSVPENIQVEKLTAKTRPEESAAEQLLKAAQQQLQSTKGNSRPNIAAFASYEYHKGFEVDGDGNYWTAGLSLNYPLYDGANNRSKESIARAALRKAQENYRKVKLAVAHERKSTDMAYQNAIDSLSVTQKVVTQAEESATINRNRFKNGVILSSELIDVETRLTEARMLRAVSEARYQIARADRLRAYGLLTPESI
ncbi:MAG: TolC family protein, partial [Opitutales bacterium]|nr:TolC family protein [Opitutales bacterium]